VSRIAAIAAVLGLIGTVCSTGVAVLQFYEKADTVLERDTALSQRDASQSALAQLVDYLNRDLIACKEECHAEGKVDRTVAGVRRNVDADGGPAPEQHGAR